MAEGTDNRNGTKFTQPAKKELRSRSGITKGRKKTRAQKKRTGEAPSKD